MYKLYYMFILYKKNMGTGFFLIILSIINILFLFFGIFLIFTPYYYYSILLIFIAMVSYLLISIIFFKYTNKQLKIEENTLKSFKLSKCIYKENDNKIIGFKLYNNKWVSVKDDNLIFDLENYLFKKSFIIARIIRELRYPVISNQLSLSKLLNLKLKINNFDKLIVRFIDENDIKEYVLVNKNISRNTILSQAISKSRYYEHYLSNRFYNEYMKKIEQINENIYLN